LSPRFDAIDPETAFNAVADRLRPLLANAKKLGAFINVDMESFSYRDITFDLFKRILNEPEFKDMTNVGIVVQAYLRDAERDFEKLLDFVNRRGTPITVRLVKGAYWDMETAVAAQNNATPPVWLRKWESDACYERITRLMLQNAHIIRPAFASHNVRSLAHAIAVARERNLTPSHYEIQMLHGMGDPLKQAMVDLNQCLRVYTPYGELMTGMGYLIRRLLENTANDSFLKQSYHARDAGNLLANPNVARPPSTLPRKAHYVDFNEDEPMPNFQNETVISFNSAHNRDRFAEALKNARAEFDREYPLFIEGQHEKTGTWINSKNPSNTDEIVGKRAFAEWRFTTAAERAALLRRVADHIRIQTFDFAALITLEAGKPWREAVADVAEAIDYFNYYAGCAEALEAHPRRRDLPGEDNALVYQPKGVCAVIAPCSFPLALLSNMVAAALAAGNTVVLKPASATPVIAATLVALFEKLGFPRGVVNFLPGPGHKLGPHLASHSDVHVIAFTGSRDVGLQLLGLAAQVSPTQRHIKRVVAELGGKNAIIVDEDADIDQAVSGVVTSAFGYSGQKCTSCSRVIVLRDIRDEFLTRLIETARDLPVGSAEDPTTIVGPLIDESAYNTVRQYIGAADAGAKCVLGAKPVTLSGGWYVGPTIFTNVDPEAALAQEEVLGPVLALIDADDFNHALDIANGTRYALTGGLFSRSPDHIERAKREFLVGNLYINRKITGSRVDIEPFGGLKMSGDGAKAGGPDYLRHFCNARTITEHTLRHGLAPAKEAEIRA
jgi:RHH-type proline utilization regulon transcriptional repressor/proline dehydrogenase/delta 1-pyrroline-5-carboxylate dehydrogenase